MWQCGYCPFDGMNDDDNGICHYQVSRDVPKLMQLSWYMWNVWFWSCE